LSARRRAQAGGEEGDENARATRGAGLTDRLYAECSAVSAEYARPAGQRTGPGGGCRSRRPYHPPGPVHVVVNWSAVSGSQTGLWMSYEGGYFQQEGLDVEL